jgi:hypothetical protein
VINQVLEKEVGVKEAKSRMNYFQIVCDDLGCELIINGNSCPIFHLQPTESIIAEIVLQWPYYRAR